jgi:hypothetical protein
MNFVRRAMRWVVGISLAVTAMSALVGPHQMKGWAFGLAASVTMLWFLWSFIIHPLCGEAWLAFRWRLWASRITREIARDHAARLQGICPNCRYDLRGNESRICPECGCPVPASALVPPAAEGEKTP